MDFDIYKKFIFCIVEMCVEEQWMMILFFNLVKFELFIQTSSMSLWVDFWRKICIAGERYCH